MPASLIFQSTIFGGLNLNDQSDLLLLRSHSQAQGGWQQKAPVESTKMDNIDFDQGGIKQRDGSTFDYSISSFFSSGEKVLAGGTYEYFSTNGQRITVIVTSNSIYTNQSGSFSRVNDSSGSAYFHNEDVERCTFAVADGHLFIGLDNNNFIQVYRNGANLDPELNNGNTYFDSFGTGNNVIDGIWDTGYYLVASFQGRLVYSTGNTLVNYSSVPTSTSGIWQKTTAGFYQGGGLIRALKTYTPDYNDSVFQTLYIFTSSGPEITNDLESQIQKVEGGPVPLNHQSIVGTKSWLMMMTETREILGINRNVFIDLGRRFTDQSGISPIETFNISNASNNAFAYYNEQREQVYFSVPTGVSGNNKACFVLDLQLGEPVVGQAQPVFENLVRLSYWQINDPTNNDWYISFYRRVDSVIAVLPNGNAYTFMNGRNDQNTIAIDAEYETLDFNAGLQAVNKGWINLALRGRFVGNFATVITYLADRSTTVESNATYSQSATGATYGDFLYGQETYSDVILVKGQDDIDLYSESLKIRLKNSELNQNFRFDTIEIKYLIGAEDR